MIRLVTTKSLSPPGEPPAQPASPSSKPTRAEVVWRKLAAPGRDSLDPLIEDQEARVVAQRLDRSRFARVAGFPDQWV
jgi:hypothetical protein